MQHVAVLCGTVDGILLHVLGHVSVLDHSLSTGQGQKQTQLIRIVKVVVAMYTSSNTSTNNNTAQQLFRHQLWGFYPLELPYQARPKIFPLEDSHICQRCTSYQCQVIHSFVADKLTQIKLLKPLFSQGVHVIFHFLCHVILHHRGIIYFKIRVITSSTMQPCGPP